MKHVSARYLTEAELDTLRRQPSTTEDNLGIVAGLPDGKLVLVEVDQETFAGAVAEAKRRATVAA